jgi:hypothetical protein
MARQTLTKLTAPGSFPALPLTADSADLPMTAADTSNKEQFVATGKDLIVAHNTGASAYTVTITSVADGRNRRTGDITSYSIGAGEYAAFGPFEKAGWMQTDGKIYLEANNTAVKFGVVALP